LITNPLLPYPFAFARLNASRSSASDSHSLSDQTTLKHHLVTMKHETYFEKINMLLILLTLIVSFLIDRTLGKAFDSQRSNKDIFQKDLRGMQSAKENAIERSSKLLHESSEIRNKRQIQFRTILCLSPK
jgi:hypothetical protein